MTVSKLMQSALALLPATPEESGDSSDFVVEWVNLALAECAEAENALRLSAGEEPLAGVPEVATAEDEIPLDDRILRGPLVYAVAALAARDDGDGEWESALRSRFLGSLSELTPGAIGATRDVYGGEE